MSFEAIAWVRRRLPGAFGIDRDDRREFAEKWLTVPTDDRSAAFDAFRRLGYDVRGMTIQPQAEATETAARRWA